MYQGEVKTASMSERVQAVGRDAERISEVEESMAGAHASAQQLKNMIFQLSDRLAPVLGPDNTLNGKPAPDVPQPIKCGVAAGFDGITGTVYEAQRKVGEILDRLRV